MNGGEQSLLIEPALQVGIDRSLVADLDELQPEQQPDPARQKLSGELDGAALRLAQGVVVADQHHRGPRGGPDHLLVLDDGLEAPHLPPARTALKR